MWCVYEHDSCRMFKKGDEKVVEQTYKMTETQIHSIGDLIDKVDPIPENEKNVSVQYKINSATLYTTPAEAGIHENQIARVEYQKNLEKGIELSKEEVMQSPMIIVDVTITNINEEDPTISMFHLVERKAKGHVEDIGSPCYYSMGQEVDSQKYMHFSLLPGQNIDMKIGWYINPEDYALKTIYLTDNLNGDEKRTNYVNLGL